VERIAVSLCPNCIHCPEVVIEGETVCIGEDENIVVLKTSEWNALVDAVQSGQLARM
jgi:transcription initiation factor IIF auxiliary subunit